MWRKVTIFEKDALQGRPGAVGTDFNIAFAPSSESSDLPDGVSFQLQKGDNQAFRGFKLSEGCVNESGCLLSAIIQWGSVRQRFQSVVQRDLPVLTVPQAPQPPVAGAHRQGLEPAGKRLWLPKGGKALPEPQADFLGEIIKVRCGAGKTTGELEDIRTQGLGEGRKGSRLTALGGLDEADESIVQWVTSSVGKAVMHHFMEFYGGGVAGSVAGNKGGVISEFCWVWGGLARPLLWGGLVALGGGVMLPDGSSGNTGK